MTLILRGAAGVLVGAVYGLLIGTIVYPLTQIGLDREHPGPLIPDAIGMAWFTTIMAGLIAGVSAILVGLIVGLSGVNRRKGALIGFVAGLLVMGLLFISSPPPLVSLRDLIALLVTLVALPLGLALVGLLVSAISSQLNRFDW